MLKQPEFFGIGSRVPYFIIKKIDPISINKIEINLTVTIKTCRTFVFAIDLKLKAAPETKKSPNQRQKLFMI